MALNKVITGTNDLSTKDPEGVKEWNYEKNDLGINPSSTAFGSHKVVWWKCPNLRCRSSQWTASFFIIKKLFGLLKTKK